MSFRFEYISRDYSDHKYTIAVTSDAEGLNDVLEDFKTFLQGCGFSIDGDLEVVDYPKLKEEKIEEVEEEEKGGCDAPPPIDYNSPYTDKFNTLWRLHNEEEEDE